MLDSVADCSELSLEGLRVIERHYTIPHKSPSSLNIHSQVSKCGETSHHYTYHVTMTLSNPSQASLVNMNSLPHFITSEIKLIPA